MSRPEAWLYANAHVRWAEHRSGLPENGKRRPWDRAAAEPHHA